MPTLNWIGKKAVENHHRHVAFHLLKAVPDLSVGGLGTGNLLVEGDNLLGLKALLPYYAGQVKCIYIDPPYNTGNEGWIYNDNVNSPEMRDWLGKVVGKELEDLTRHDKWLCMMYPRLALLRQMLRDDGAIFISIGRDELANLIALCDDIFSRDNLVEILVWNTHGHTENQEDITGVHEYILHYAKKKSELRMRSVVDPSIAVDSKIRRRFAENSITKNGPKNPASVIQLPVGFPCELDSLDLDPMPEFDRFKMAIDEQGYITRELTRRFSAVYPVRQDRMIVRAGRLIDGCRVFAGWMSADKLREFIANNCEPLDDDGTLLRFFLSKNGVVYYRREGRESHYVQSVIRDVGTTEKNRYMLEAMGIDFTYPKPLDLISYICSLYAESSDIVMDSFCGSATTGHAVLRLNQEDGGNRRFILVEMDSNICRNVAARRLRSVFEGYSRTDGAEIASAGEGFQFAELGEPLFDKRGRIRTAVPFLDLARHVYFTETGETLPQLLLKENPLIGVCRGTAIYLLYNGILRDKSVNGGNVLTTSVLSALPNHEGSKVIYGTACRIGSERLRREGIVFKQLPYKLRVEAP
jgi:adenine-specific DNA-methyltransferase